jgi:hypothetical protein
MNMYNIIETLIKRGIQMRKAAVIAGMFILFCTYGCQTPKVHEMKSPMGPTGPEGVYLAKTSTPQGEVEFTMTIKANGTGRIESMMGNQEISDIAIEGNNFGFNTTINTQMGEMALAFIGAVDGDSISGTIGTQMGSLPFSGLRKQVKI